MGQFTDFLWGTAKEAVGAGLGIMLGQNNDQRQLEQQKKLQQLQIEGQTYMNSQNWQNQLSMWKATSYPAQMEQLQKAGLNPGLMYGMGGGGGTTTGSFGGNVSGANAPQGGHEAIDMMGMGLQYGMMEAQKKLLEAQAANLNVDTEKKAGVDTEKVKTEIKSLSQGIENQKAQQELTEIQADIARTEDFIKGKTQNTVVAMLQTQLREATERLEILTNDKQISNATKQQKIEEVGVRLAGVYIENELKKEQTKMTSEEIEKIKTEVTNLKNYWDLDNFIEREKVRLIDKGINVALISSTINSIIHMATGGRR